LVELWNRDDPEVVAPGRKRKNRSEDNTSTSEDDKGKRHNPSQDRSWGSRLRDRGVKGSKPLDPPKRSRPPESKAKLQPNATGHQKPSEQAGHCPPVFGPEMTIADIISTFSNWRQFWQEYREAERARKNRLEQ
jgi:hypothetical protein